MVTASLSGEGDSPGPQSTTSDKERIALDALTNQLPTRPGMTNGDATGEDGMNSSGSEAEEAYVRIQKLNSNSCAFI